MPRMTFESKNKNQNAFDYPSLKLEQNERARILLIESEPEVEYVHTLRAPQMTDGRIEYEEQRQKSGETIRVPKMTFIGKHICMGSFDVVAESGTDPKGCPVCEEATKSSIVDAPQRRFALHVIRYQTQPGSFNVAEPFGVNLLAWGFTDKIFNQIVDFTEEWGDLRSHDLRLGPCTNKQYQQFEINVSADAAWQANEERKRIVQETYKSNKSPDLSRVIARRLTRDQVQQDLEKVRSANREAYGKRDEEPALSPSEIGSADLFTNPETQSNREPAPAITRPERKDTIDFDELLTGL